MTFSWMALPFWLLVAWMVWEFVREGEDAASDPDRIVAYLRRKGVEPLSITRRRDDFETQFRFLTKVGRWLRPHQRSYDVLALESDGRRTMRMISLCPNPTTVEKIELDEARTGPWGP